MIEGFAVLILGIVIYLAFHLKREAEAQAEYEALRREHGFNEDFDYDFTDLDHP